MARCDVCGNDYQQSFEVVMSGSSYTFDSFECAIQKLAPTCAHCGCRILGHGIEGKSAFYCCAHCARESSEAGAQDNVAKPTGAPRQR